MISTNRKLYLPVMILLLGASLLGACGKADKPQAASPTASPVESSTASPAVSPEVSPAGNSLTWSAPPEMAIDPSKQYEAVFETSEGSFTLELFAADAPGTVNNFVFLSRQHYYDGVTFHRIIETFMIQGGDPTGKGSGGPGYTIKDELNGPHKYEPGIVAMANSGPDSGGSQFFICTGEDSRNLNSYPDYAIFGKVSSGMDIVTKIAKAPVVMNPGSPDRSPSKPEQPIVINSIEIKES
jgi:cyclophilin family peptidyl-prolyl cis-trans isomerase